MASTKITRKGQITIPIEIRKELGLKEGDYLSVRSENGKIVAENQIDIARRLAGSLAEYAREINKGLSMEEIIAKDDAAVEQAIIEDYLETERQIRQESERCRVSSIQVSS